MTKGKQVTVNTENLTATADSIEQCIVAIQRGCKVFQWTPEEALKGIAESLRQLAEGKKEGA